MDAECVPATSTAAAGIQSLRPVELGQAFCSGEWACNATGEWRSLWQEEEKSTRSRALYPARGRTVRSWFGPLPFPPIHIDPPALDTEAKRRRQAHQLATEQVYEPLRVRAEEEQERKVPRSLRSKTTPRSVFPGKSPGMVCFRGPGQLQGLRKAVTGAGRRPSQALPWVARGFSAQHLSGQKPW